jgi:CcmD family protein
MLENGKIFVVVAVLATILVGLFVYLFILDKKIGKVEKEIKAESTHKEK